MKRYLSIALIGLFLVVTVLTAVVTFSGSAEAAATGILKIHMLKIGDGRQDCFIIELPNGNRAVMDIPEGGSDDVIAKLNELGIPSIKFLIGTHAHNDHIGGMDEFLDSGFTINNTQIYYPKGSINASGTDYNNLVAAANRRGLTIKKLVRHDDILNTTYDGKDLRIGVLSPHDYKVDGVGGDDYQMNNTASMAVKFRYGQKAMLCMADCSYQSEDDILSDPDTSDIWGEVLKVGHHGLLSGGFTSTTDAFLNDLRINFAFITNDDTNIESGIKSRLQSRDIKYWIAGVSGDVWIQTDGTNPWNYSEAPTWQP